MQSSFLANSNVDAVSHGMIRVTDATQEFKRDERLMILTAMYNCVYNSKLKDKYSLSDLMVIVDNMRHECKRKKLPEFGGAERYVIGEL